MNTRRNAGFTLIELLTVIAIIAILASILFPVFAKAREKAGTAACTSNNKQLATAMMMYTTDYDQRFPTAGDGWNMSPVLQSDWVHVDYHLAGGIEVELGSLFPYVKNAQCYVCPSSDLCSAPYLLNGVEYTRTSYCMNYNLAPMNGGTETGMKITRVAFPANTFLFIEDEELSFGFGPGQFNDAMFYVSSTPGSGTITQADMPPGGSDATSRHSNGGLAAYCDGHVKWHPFSELAALPYPGGTAGAPYGTLTPYYFPIRTSVNAMP